MAGRTLLGILALFTLITICTAKFKKPFPYKEEDTEVKYSNPGYVKDRLPTNNPREIEPPIPYKNRNKKPWTNQFMEYCEPNQCEHYYKPICGMNRKTMQLRWFKSNCHLTLWNFCAYYKGYMQYDSAKPASTCNFAVELRTSKCEPCYDESIDPLCGESAWDGHLALFRNECTKNNTNCLPDSLDEYEIIGLEYCIDFMMKGGEIMDVKRKKELIVLNVNKN